MQEHGENCVIKGQKSLLVCTNIIEIHYKVRENIKMDRYGEKIEILNKYS
jgi:hypothetical protein